MNHLSVTLSESTIEKFLKSQLANIAFQNEEKSLYDNNGLKVIANIHIKKIEFGDFELIEPDAVAIKRITVEFEKLNIVVGVDIKQIKSEKVIHTPDIPPVRDPITGRIIIPGREVPDIVLWRIDLFGNNPDIKLTIGLEEYIKPDISTRFQFIIQDFKVALSIKDFHIHDFIIPDSIGETIKNHIVEEVKKKLKDAAGGKFGELIGHLGDLLKYLPVPDISGLIIESVIKSRQFEDYMTQIIQSQLHDYVVYIPGQFKLGSNDSPIELNISSPTVSVTQDQLMIDVDVHEL